MSAFVTLDSIAFATPDATPLFDGLTLAFGRERTGIVGRNGSGKSSLLRLIAGELMPARGTVRRNGSIGLLGQHGAGGRTVAEMLGAEPALARLSRLESGTGWGDDAAEADWGLPLRLRNALDETGLSALTPDRPAASLSGGEHMRVALARLLLAAPDLLLLDEPTNNLDAEGRAVVYRIIERWPGGVVLASHDRALLETMDRIAELTPVGTHVVGGGWSAFSVAREAERAVAQRDLDRAERAGMAAGRDAQIARDRKARRDKAGRVARARGGQSKLLLGKRKRQAENTGGRIDRLADRSIADAGESLAKARTRVEILVPLAIDLPPSGLPATRELVELTDVVLRHGERKLLGPISFHVRGPERSAIRGRNGSGKTSLLRLIAGEIEPDEGTVRRPSHRIAMLDQHVTLLDPAATLLGAILELQPGLSEHDARAVLARAAFRGDQALRIVASLSGGERLRAGLAAIMADPVPPQLLLLDEPTNHLDLASVELLEAALSGFDGALVAVSHDRDFLEAVAIERTIALG